MPRHESAYELTDAEKRDLIKLIEQGRPLPEKYRFLLFDDKREVELVWNGKSREVCTAILPFQTLEHIDEPRKEKRDDDELGLDTGGRQVKGWTNKLIWGDNKLILSSLKAGALRRQIEDAGGLKLINVCSFIPIRKRLGMCGFLSPPRKYRQLNSAMCGVCLGIRRHCVMSAFS